MGAYGGPGSAELGFFLPTGIDEGPSPFTPRTFRLRQNYPNPFNPTTAIGFEIGDVGFVTLRVYDLLGHKVTTLVNTELAPGDYQVRLNAEGFASGIYFYQLKAGGLVETKKLMLIR
jgi:hypothetical protein